MDGEVVLLALSWETIQAAVELGPGSIPVQEHWEAYLVTLATLDVGLLDPASEKNAPGPFYLRLWGAEFYLSIMRPLDVSRAAPGTTNPDRQLGHHGELVEVQLAGVYLRLEELVAAVHAPADDRASIEQVEVALVGKEGLDMGDALLRGLAHAEDLVPDVFPEILFLTNRLHDIVTEVLLYPARKNSRVLERSFSPLVLPALLSSLGLLIEGLSELCSLPLLGGPWELVSDVVEVACKHLPGHGLELLLWRLAYGSLGHPEDVVFRDRRKAPVAEEGVIVGLAPVGEEVLLDVEDRVLGHLHQGFDHVDLLRGWCWHFGKEEPQEDAEIVRKDVSGIPGQLLVPVASPIDALVVWDVPVLGEISSNGVIEQLEALVLSLLQVWGEHGEERDHHELEDGGPDISVPTEGLGWLELWPEDDVVASLEADEEPEMYRLNL